MLDYRSVKSLGRGFLEGSQNPMVQNPSLQRKNIHFEVIEQELRKHPNDHNFLPKMNQLYSTFQFEKSSHLKTSPPQKKNKWILKNRLALSRE